MTLALALLLLGNPDEIKHEFMYRADKPLNSVNLAGSFNNWNNGANPMKLDTDGRTWRLRMDMKPGRYHYKFVLNGTDWITDPQAKSEDDGNGNQNSILLIMPPEYKTPAAPADNRVTASALRHDMRAPFLNFDKGLLSVMVRTRAGDVEGVSLAVKGARTPMRRVRQDEFYEFYEAEVKWNEKDALKYHFLLDTGTGAEGFGPSGVGSKDDFWTISPATYKPFKVAAWVPGSVFYQIFPDRFENGDKKNDPENLTAWTAAPKGDSWMGGDAAGVAKRSSYLADLGIDAIYFNPVFASPVNHRYETTDFLKIDSRFASNDEFAKLTESLEKKGIRTVLDGVFNHVAPDFFAFQDLLKNQENSRYKDWFFVKAWPVKYEDNPNYVAWWGYKSMPKLNVTNPEVRDYLLKVPPFWAKNAKIHGWRLDVANEVDMNFWRDFRKVVKGIDPSLWIVGEVWGDGTPWLEGDQWDSIMGYQFRDAALRFVAEGKMRAEDFGKRLMEVYESYPPQVSRNLMNLLSSHDTARFITMCGGNRDLAKLGATLQLTWVGSPSVYYGEEIGMLGDHDPGCRAGMEWPKANDANDMLVHYKRLLTARNSSAALRVGRPQILSGSNDQNWLAFSRSEGKETAVVIANRSDRAQTVTVKNPAGHPLKDIVSGQTYATGQDLRVTLSALSSAVLVDGRNQVFTKASNAKSVQRRSNHEKR